MQNESVRLREILRDRDLWTGIGFLVFALVLLLGTANLRPDPRALPKLLGWIIAFSGIALSAQAVFRVVSQKTSSNDSPPKASTEENRIIAVFAFVGLIVAYFLVPVLGFYTAFGMYVFVLHAYLAEAKSVRQLGKAFVFTVIVLLVLFVLFRVLLFVRTPSGFLI